MCRGGGTLIFQQTLLRDADSRVKLSNFSQGMRRRGGDSSSDDDSEDGQPGGSDDDDMYGDDGGADDPFFQHDDDAFNDPFFQVGGREELSVVCNAATAMAVKSSSR